MAQKILGLDLGTNSIGWAVICRDDDDTCRLLHYGSHIFQEGVARGEKGNEKPCVEKRTSSRASRRHYDRRRLHKIQLLKILIELDMCPYLSEEELNDWRYKRIYPLKEEFIQWQHTNDKINKNPYHDRYLALTSKLDLFTKKGRYILGRALYHLCQRRGFLSNRKDATQASDGPVNNGINDLTEAMEKAGCRYLGEYFYKLYGEHKKIRTTYTDRLAHTEKEFYAICKKQGLSDEEILKLHKAIFYQRPLKSQKGLVGKCVFEPSKSRCPLSHPLFEEFRMWSFINNIKIKGSADSEFRPLSEKETDEILPLFYRKSKPTFPFEDIAKKIAGKGKYAYKDDKRDAAYKFNFRMATVVSGCPVITGLKDIFGEDYRRNIAECYDKADGKTLEEILNDIWHVLYSFDRNDKMEQWATDHLQLNEEDAEKLTKIKVPQGYASLSLCAIRKILPFLKAGMRYDEAVFVANLDKVLPDNIRNNPEARKDVILSVCDTVANFAENPLNKAITKEQAVKGILEDIPDIDFGKLDLLYHPSRTEVYPEATMNSKGELRLGSPRTSSIRNPMAMRALFRLRHLINQLLEERKIDRTTTINIELARELNDANMRKAIERYQREKEKINKESIEKIKKFYQDATGNEIEPTDDEILKFRLWEEQEHICLYTGEQISITEFIGVNPKYDIEHTVPRSLGGDSAQTNLTLCNSVYNRQIKRNLLPSQLTDHETIIQRIETLGWDKEIERLANEIARLKTSMASTKDAKDGIIQKRHYLKMHLNYWRDKVRGFKLTEVPEGFSRRQGVDTGIIGKYAREYLRTLFRSEDRQIFLVKGSTTAEFRKMWGLQDEYAKKERINHCHHTIDAIVVACIGRSEYQRWAKYHTERENYELGSGSKPDFRKPWPTFTEDLKSLDEKILVSHNVSHSTFNQTKKLLKRRGKIIRNSKGDPVYEKGDSVRGALHKDTYYGAINRDGTVRYVIRRYLSDLAEKDIKNIVDPAVREKVELAVKERGFKNLLSEPVWMNREKGREIKKVRIFTPSVTNPIHLKPLRDESRHSYKRSLHVANDSNYCLCIYEGNITGKKIKRSFKIVNLLEAARSHKSGKDIYPLSDKDGLPLKWKLRVGDMVLFYEKTPKELYECSKEELVKRLYKISGISINPTGPGYGLITLRYHKEARPAESEAKNINGCWKYKENIRPGIIQRHTQFNAIVEGEDFILTLTGEIHFLHPLC